jgi:hypothetical protein
MHMVDAAGENVVRKKQRSYKADNAMLMRRMTTFKL